MGGQPEKLLTLQEAARRLGVPADDVEGMIHEGELPSFRLAGNLIRLRLGDVEAVRLKRKGGGRPGGRRSSLAGRVSDFFYFNDFYLLVFLILLTLLAIILTL